MTWMDMKFKCLMVSVFLMLEVNGNAECNVYHTVISFHHNAHWLTKKARTQLDLIKKKDIIQGSWIIQGHASSQETRNLQLSKLRANAVFDYLSPTNGNIWVNWYGSFIGDKKLAKSQVVVAVRERCRSERHLL